MIDLQSKENLEKFAQLFFPDTALISNAKGQLVIFTGLREDHVGLLHEFFQEDFEDLPYDTDETFDD